ncbi:MAG: ribosome silencing factor [Betaproteobacteria bacterium]|nr:ribosome silencing factor [Betaproteobacteria bacterium]
MEDVKAQDIVVFDTEHLSALFERVIIASGTSNRQTKALAASVRDAVREAGFAKPRIEGEGNGEWIIVDCNQVVVHIMQPNFRQYYHLEELWGEKPVRLKLGAAKPVVAKASEEAKPAAKKATAKTVEPSMRRSSAAKKGVEEAFPSKAALKKAADKAAGIKAPAKKAAAKTSTAKPAAKPAAKAAVKAVVVKPEVKKTVAKKAAAKPAAAKKAPAKKAAPRKA